MICLPVGRMYEMGREILLSARGLMVRPLVGLEVKLVLSNNAWNTESKI